MPAHPVLRLLLRGLAASWLIAASACGGDGGGGGDASPADDGGAGDGGINLGGDVIEFGSARGLALDADRVYWAAWLGGEVASARKDGSERAMILEDTGPTRVVRAGDHVYAFSDESGFTAVLSRAPAAGGAAHEVLDSEARQCCLGVGGDAVYWIRRGGAGENEPLMRLLGDGVPEEVESDFPDFLAIGGGAIWLADQGELSAYPLTGGAVEQVATFSEKIFAAAAGTSAVFVITSDEAGAVSLWGVDRPAGDPELLWSGEGFVYAPAPLAIDSSHAYFAVGDFDSYSTLRRVPREGGDAEVVADRQPRVAEIEVDDTHVFWTNVGLGGDVEDQTRRGRLMRTEK